MKKLLYLTTLAVACCLLPAASMAAEPTQTATFILTWQDNGGVEKGFVIERRVGQTGTFAEVGKAPANNLDTMGKIVKWTDTVKDDPGGVEYCYRVAAFNDAGMSGWSNVACATSPVIKLPPNVPGNVTVTVTVTVTTAPQ